MAELFLVLGKNGQVGARLTEILGKYCIAADSKDVDFMQPLAPQLDAFTGGAPLRGVFNAAAYTKVDLAEGEGKDQAMRINAQAVGELAVWCARQGVPLLHYSTDYVFDGSGQTPWREGDAIAPLSVYGHSKAEGEKLIAASGAKHMIVRTSWVYDAVGKNFMLTVLRLIHEREALNMVADQVGAPTFAKHLAAASIEAFTRAMSLEDFPSGVYHLSNSGQTSWHGFAQAIFMLATARESREYEAGQQSGQSTIICKQISPIPTEAYPLPARRPLNSRLDSSKIRSMFGLDMPDWEQGLQECFETWYASTQREASRAENH